MKSILTSLFVIAVILSANPVLAHSDSPSDPASTIEIMQQMEDVMMGDEEHERMEELMTNLINGDLSESEQQEMIRIMQDEMSGPGAMSMMMRGTSPFFSQTRSPGFGMMGFGYGLGLNWITMILIWILLLSGIIAIWKWLSKKK